MIFPPRRFTRAFPVVALLPVFSSCATFERINVLPHRKPRPALAARVVPQRVGTITLVNEAEHFVLIDTGVAAVPPIGTALKCFTGEASSGVVAVGNVYRRPFVVADIVQGSPKKGDGAFQ